MATYTSVTTAMNVIDSLALWRRTLAPQGDRLDALRLAWQDACTARELRGVWRGVHAP